MTKIISAPIDHIMRFVDFRRNVTNRCLNRNFQYSCRTRPIPQNRPHTTAACGSSNFPMPIGKHIKTRYFKSVKTHYAFCRRLNNFSDEFSNSFTILTIIFLINIGRCFFFNHLLCLKSL